MKNKPFHSVISSEQKNFLEQKKREKRKITGIQLGLFLAFFLFWELGADSGFLNPFLCSSPSRVCVTLFTLFQSGELFWHVGITLGEVLACFLLVLGIGTLGAIALWWNTTLEKVLEPFLVLCNSLPKSALAPVFIVWLGNNGKTILVAAVTVVVFGTILTLYHSFTQYDPGISTVILTLGGTKKDVLWKGILPGNRSTFFSVMKVNIGLSLVGVIIGEFLAAKAGLGYLIIYGSQVFKLDLVYAAIGVLCLLSVLFYGGIRRWERMLETRE